METTKVVILRGETDFDWIINPGGNEPSAQVTQKALAQAIEKIEISLENIDYIIATGIGREYVTFADRKEPEFLCLARGIDYLIPSTKMVLDLGARKSLAMKCNKGVVMKMAKSDRCAAGTGAYLEVAANTLRISINEMDELFFKSNEILEIQSTCAVFIESEIISLVHNGCKPEDIVRGIFRGLAGRLLSQLFEIGIGETLAVVGGVARSKAMIVALEEKTSLKISVPDPPEIVGALGAALIAQKGADSS